MTPALSRSLAAFVLLLACLQVPGLAQQAARATLTGTVTDPHGAAVAGVKITGIAASTLVRAIGSASYILTERRRRGTR